MPAIIVETFESGGATVGPDSPGVDLKFAVLGLVYLLLSVVMLLATAVVSAVAL